jgi:hypothetical protein
VVVLLTALQGSAGTASHYWLYALKIVICGGLVWALRSAVPEIRWTISLPAVAAGVGVFALWVGLEGHYPPLGDLLSKPKPGATPPHVWNPHHDLGDGSLLAWGMIILRVLGTTLVIPPIEEVFYRSLIYRAVERSDFLAMPLTRFAVRGFLFSALVFGISHREWLPAILCGMTYQALVLLRGHLGDAMTAHGLTNLLLGLWVAWKGAWQFW